MPSLQITDVVPRIQYVASAAQVNFVIPFVFFALTDPAVYLTPAGQTPSDYSDILIYVTNYTIVANVNYTGTMTLNVPASAGDIITIVRAMPDQRLNYYLPAGSFTADSVNTDFESEVLMIQQNKMYDQVVAPHYNLSANPLLPNMAGGQDIILPVLGANEVWVKDPSDNFITTASLGNGGAVVTTITQNGHGFIVGNVIYFNGLLYAKAKADSAVDAEVIGIVTQVTDVNTFQLTTGGSVTVLAGLVPGSVYFLSDVSAGALTVTAPTTIGYINKPLLIAVSATSGFFFNFRGKVIPATSFAWNLAPVSITMAVTQGYIPSAVGLVTLTLPASIAVGDTFEVAGMGAGGWAIAQGGGQTIHFGNMDTTPGAGGSLASTNRYDSIKLVCVATNTDLVVISSVGNITIV